MLQQVWECRYLFEITALCSLDMYPAVKLLNCIVVLFLIVWETSLLFSILPAPIHIATNNEQRSPFLQVLTNTGYFFSFLSFLKIAIQTNVKWYLIVVLTCISLMISYNGHLYICLLAICMASLENCLFRSSVHFFHELFVWYWVLWIFIYFGY